MKSHILIKVIIAMILALAAGWYTGPDMPIFGVPALKIYSLIGQLFLNALNLVVVPLVASSIISGTARMGSEPSFGKLGMKTFGYYILTSTLAVIVGLLITLVISPGISQNTVLPNLSMGEETKLAEIAAHSDGFAKISEILLKLIPSNILAAAAQGQMLGLILFSLFFGFFISRIESHPSSIMTAFWKGVFQIMMAITHAVMLALPIGVFGLVAKVAATTGFEAISSVALFFATVVLGLAIFGFIVLPMILASVAKVNPLMHLRAMAPALFTAFSTSSSSAALPITIECVEKRAAVSNRVCSFTIPLGSSLNLAGTALYTCIATLFIAQVYGVHLPIFTLCLVAFMSLITSIGTAGIPSASLISIVVILNTIGAPADGIALILATERILDMCRTPINVLSNTCCAVLVARSEGEKDVLSAVPMSFSKAGE